MEGNKDSENAPDASTSALVGEKRTAEEAGLDLVPEESSEVVAAPSEEPVPAPAPSPVPAPQQPPVPVPAPQQPVVRVLTEASSNERRQKYYKQRIDGVNHTFGYVIAVLTHQVSGQCRVEMPENGA